MICDELSSESVMLIYLSASGWLSFCFHLKLLRLFFFRSSHVVSVTLVTFIQVVLLARMSRNQRTLSVQAEHQKASCLAEHPKNRKVTS